MNHLASTSRSLLKPSRTSTPRHHALTRAVSSSPYGRTHVWKRRPLTLPKPFVPIFPQRVVRADGSTYTQYTTSPRSVINLTRDTSNNPLWNPALFMADSAEEDSVAGRLGRFNRRFDGLGGHGEEVDWMSGAPPAELELPKKETKAGKGKAK